MEELAFKKWLQEGLWLPDERGEETPQNASPRAKERSKLRTPGGGGGGMMGGMGSLAAMMKKD